MDGMLPFKPVLRTNDFPFEFIEEHGFKLDLVGLETAMEACASGPGPCR